MITPDDQNLSESPLCSKCGLPMPPLPPDLAAAAAAAASEVAFSHAECPGEEPQVEGRWFEVHVSVIEVPAAAGGAGGEPPRELLSFSAGHRAKDLDAAMRPLAIKLGEKWAKAEKQAGVADS